MNITEVVGMISTGALLTLGAIYVMDRIDDGMRAPPPTLQVATPASPDVTRGVNAVTSVAYNATPERIKQIVAQAQQPLNRAQLTPEQEEAIEFFERIARKQNEKHASGERSDGGAALQFSNMAVDKLWVRYFYKIDLRYTEIDRGSLLEQQAESVRANLCGSEATQILMDRFGFHYTYVFVSSDGRMAGEVRADASTCT